MNVVGTNITSTTNDQVYFSTEKPTLNVEAALYIFSSSNSFLGRIEDYISNDTTKYYTCMNTTSSCSGFNAYVLYEYISTTATELTCSVYSVKSYINPVQAKVRYHGYLSKDLDSIRDNTYDSNIKEEIDAWYEKHLLIIQPMAKIVTMYYIHHKLSILYFVTITVFIREM